ncbi:uncharacterized protein BT62DRAFT_925335 [Guyanagaster necrorhizus]|uniref:Uncharacterized protein n=1 Tax=Guyanagaster necrorhizus TaxID=856835 RepID=A0A9P8AYD8_9AGAR|nr:uncharacterized protein BT62DRAFT_925335 [Guyanagaster necrorhizus MCA 3950]KAG7452794.1 hypothetical protein BT62DRAFT_925335 [Guyanagaster necrorhizus MCA 3950]
MSLLVANSAHISKLIATTSMSVHSFSWNPVTVLKGWYILQASLSTTTTVINSSAFFVDDGSDLACSISSSLHSIVPTVKRHSSSLVNIIAPAVGTTAGAAIAFIIVSTAYFHPRWWRRSMPPRRRRSYIVH